MAVICRFRRHTAWFYLPYISIKLIRMLFISNCCSNSIHASQQILHESKLPLNVHSRDAATKQQHKCTQVCCYRVPEYKLCNLVRIWLPQRNINYAVNETETSSDFFTAETERVSFSLKSIKGSPQRWWRDESVC